MNFQLSKTPLEKLKLKDALKRPEAGAFTSFEGLVRNHNEGKKVKALEYEAFDKLCVKEATKILKEAKAAFDIYDISCVHRVGKLKVSDLAVWVGVTAAHRESAFKACRFVIDEIKRRLPIWKKEYYTSGDSGWVNCENCVAHEHAQPVPVSSLKEKDFYSKQLILPEVGQAGQKKLKKAKILVVGAGGLGSPSLLYLAGAGVGTLGICEDTALDISNLHRQVLYSFDAIGENKGTLAASRLKSLNPYIKINLHDERLNDKNITKIVAGYDVILDCSDNFTTKFLVNDAAYLKKIPLVTASIYQFEGQLMVHDPKNKTACLRCLWPEFPNQKNNPPSSTSFGILGVVQGVFGSLQALEAIKLILRIPSELTSKALTFDLKTFEYSKARQQSEPDCPLCGHPSKIKKIEAKNYFKK